MKKKRIGVMLSGCGVQDGSEIHESVLTLLALDRAGADAVCMAPNRNQAEVIDHLTGKPTTEKRNVLSESARIARGEIKDIREIDPAELDGVILPGGFGAAKNLSTFAIEGEKSTVDPDVAGFLKKIHEQDKPIAALCIAPTVLASVFGKEIKPELTIGIDKDTAEKIEKMGAKHQPVEVMQVVIDTDNKFVTTPCYMTATRIGEVAVGAEKAVDALLTLTRKPVGV